MTTEDQSPRADALQAEIAITRARVASEVDAIADKFTSAHVKRQLVSSAQRLTRIGLQLAKQNPVPLAVLGLGLALLVWRTASRRA